MNDNELMHAIDEILYGEHEQPYSKGDQLLMLVRTYEITRRRRELLGQRIDISDQIKRQSYHQREDNLYNDDHHQGMLDASLIAYDPDKHDPENIEEKL